MFVLKCTHVVLLNTAGFPYTFSLNVLHWMPCIFFSHSPIVGLLGCFHILAFSEECCSEHGSTDTTSRAWFHFLYVLYM